MAEMTFVNKKDGLKYYISDVIADTSISGRNRDYLLAGIRSLDFNTFYGYVRFHFMANHFYVDKNYYRELNALYK
jgi:hypothetical protein